MSETIEIHDNGVSNPGYTTDQIDEKQVSLFLICLVLYLFFVCKFCNIMGLNYSFLFINNILLEALSTSVQDAHSSLFFYALQC